MSYSLKSVQSTLPKSNPLGLKKKLQLRENSTDVGSKTIENKEKRTCIGLRLRRLFDLCRFSQFHLKGKSSPELP